MSKKLQTALALLTALLLSSPALAVSSPPPDATMTAAGTSKPAPDADDEAPPSIFDEGQPSAVQNAVITVRVNTSRNQSAHDSFTLYPYPMKPPLVTSVPMLPTNDKDLYQLLRSTGYQARPDKTRPYPIIGWRWVYAYKEGLRKSGLGEPHTILSEYQWSHEVAPYVARECHIRNAFEKGRYRRYEKAIEDYNKNRADAEADSIRTGLMPIALANRHWSIGRGQFPPGNWWLQVTRKAPGITYYWQQPLTAAPGQKLDVTLNEDNALAILGSW